MRYLIASLILLLAAGSVDARMSNRVAVAAATANFNGDGWMQSCWANFNDENYLVQSNTFTTSPWTPANSSSSNPVLTANTTDVTSPDGTNDATKMALPANNFGSGQQSYIIQFPLPSGYFAFQPYNLSIWMRGAVGGELVTVDLGDASGVTAGSWQQFTLSTNWQLYTVTGSPTTATATPHIGAINASGAVNISAETVYLWHAQASLISIPYFYVATTTAAVSTTIKQACPPGVRFRDFRKLSYAAAFQPLVPDDSSSWNSNVFNPGNTSLHPWQTYGGTYYGLFYGGTNASCNTGPNCMIILWTGNDLYHLTDPGAGTNPLIPATSSAWDDHFLYSGTWSPIPVNGHPYAIFYSAHSPSDTPAVGLATASSPGGPFTKYASNPIISGGENPAVILLPSGKLRMDIAVTLASVGYLMTSTSSDGLTWPAFEMTLQPPTTSDWDYGGGRPQEEQVWQNSHGFCEILFMENGSPQLGIYAVAQSCDPTTRAGQIWYRSPYNPGLTGPSSNAFPNASTGFGCAATFEEPSRQGDMTVFMCGADDTRSPIGGTWHATMPDY